MNVSPSLAKESGADNSLQQSQEFAVVVGGEGGHWGFPHLTQSGFGLLQEIQGWGGLANGLLMLLKGDACV